MPQNALLPSVIGNVIAARQRLSAVRQRVGLEARPQSQGTQVRELAPSPPTGPANRPGAALTAMQNQPNLQNRPGTAQGEPDLDNFQLPPEIEQAMLQKAKAFIDQHGENQQALMDKENANAPQPTAPASQPNRQSINDPNVTRGLAPLAKFFNENGRLPTPTELKVMTTNQMFHARFGRKPTETEAQLWLEKPPKGS